MRHTINSRKYGKLDFYMPDNGGYIRLESGNKHGILADQICVNGSYMGSTLYAVDETDFIKKVKSWHNARLRFIREETKLGYIPDY